MTDRIPRCSGMVWRGCVLLLALFLLPGCKKQSEPAPTPNAPNRVTTPTAPNEPNMGLPVPADPNAQADAASGLRILYAGHPGSDRESGFVRFLSEHFGTVETTNLTTFAKSESDGFDVTLMDWDWNELRGPRPSVSEMPSGPVITLGVPGGLICRGWNLKTGYL